MIGVLRRIVRRRRLQGDAMTRCRHCKQPIAETPSVEELVHADGLPYCEPGLTGRPYRSLRATLNRPRVLTYAGEA